jgi:hypothetical protein
MSQIEVIPLQAISCFAFVYYSQRVLDEYFTFTVCSSAVMFPDSDFFIDLIEKFNTEVFFTVVRLSDCPLQRWNLPTYR